MSKKYYLYIHNTMTGKTEKVEVTKEVYIVYRRTEWNIKDNNKSFYKHEIQMSSLIGANDNINVFNEFINSNDTPEMNLLKEERKAIGWVALSSLPIKMKHRFILHYYNDMSVKEISKMENVTDETIKESLKLARKKLRAFLKENKYF